MLRIGIFLVTLAVTELVLAGYAWAQSSALESPLSSSVQVPASDSAHVTGCVLLSQTFCQLQLDPNAGFIIDAERRFGAEAQDLWPHDSQLFLNSNATRYAPALSLSTSVLDSEPFTVSSRLNFWRRAGSSIDLAESLKPDAMTLDLSANYQYSKGALTFAPAGHLMYSQMGGDSVDPLLSEDSQEALTLRLDGQVSYAVSQTWGLLLPFASFQWTYQFDTLDSHSGYRWIADMSGQALSLSPEQTHKLSDQDYFNLGVGFSAQFRNGAAGFINYQKLLGHDELDDYRLRAGLRFEF